MASIILTVVVILQCVPISAAEEASASFRNALDCQRHSSGQAGSV